MPSQRTVRSMQVPILLVLALLLTTVAVLPGFAAHEEGFELDGNVAKNGELDWEDFLEGPGTVSAKTSLPAGYIAADASDDYTLPDMTTFTQGSKDTLDIDQWSCASSNNVNSKVDITNAYAAAQRNAADELIVTFGMEIRAPEGNSNVGMWFLKDPDAGCSAASGTASFTGQHDEGDVLLVSAFTNGGTVANITAYKFTAGALIAFGSGGRCGDTGDDDMCAIANDSQSVDTPWLSPDRKGADKPLAQNTFFEGGINITRTFDTEPEEECFTKFLANTRSSQSLTATLFDYTIGDLPICGGLTIVKVTDPAATDADFTFKITGPDSLDEDFTLNASTDEATASDRKSYSDVFAGQYTITETVPGGWDLTDITCRNAAGTALDVGYGLGDESVIVDVGVEADVTCTFTNQLRHSILIVKTGPDGELLADARFSAFGPGDSTTEHVLNHGEPETDGPDGIHCVDDLVPGTYAITETQTPTGYEANDNIPDVTTSNTSTCADRLADYDPAQPEGTEGTEDPLLSLEDFITAADREVPNQASPVNLIVTKWKLTMVETTDETSELVRELVRSETPLQYFEFTVYEGDIDANGDPTTDVVAGGPTETGADGEATFQGLAVGDTFTVCETAVPVYGVDEDAGYWSEGGCQSFTTQLDTDVELDFDNAPRADVSIEFFDVTGYTSIDIQCFDAGADPAVDDPIGELEVLPDATPTPGGGGTLDLEKLDLGDYDCVLKLRNGGGTPAETPEEPTA